MGLQEILNSKQFQDGQEKRPVHRAALAMATAKNGVKAHPCMAMVLI